MIAKPVGFWRRLYAIKYLPYFIGDWIRIKLELKQASEFFPEEGSEATTIIKQSIQPQLHNMTKCVALEFTTAQLWHRPFLVRS